MPIMTFLVVKRAVRVDWKVCAPRHVGVVHDNNEDAGERPESELLELPESQRSFWRNPLLVYARQMVHRKGSRQKKTA